jgi:hypothetical protein
MKFERGLFGHRYEGISEENKNTDMLAVVNHEYNEMGNEDVLETLSIGELEKLYGEGFTECHWVCKSFGDLHYYMENDIQSCDAFEMSALSFRGDCFVISDLGSEGILIGCKPDEVFAYPYEINKAELLEKMAKTQTPIIFPKSMVLDAIKTEEIGTFLDRDILFWQHGYKEADVVAEFDVFVSSYGKTFSIAVANSGECHVEIQQDADGYIQQDGKEAYRLHDDPILCAEALFLEEFVGGEFLKKINEPYLDIKVMQEGKFIGSWYDVFGSVFGSISECIEEATEDDIMSVVESAKENCVFASNFDDDDITGDIEEEWENSCGQNR